MKKFAIALMLVVTFLLGSCSAGMANAEQTWPLKVWAQNENGYMKTWCIVDEDTGVNYIAIGARFGDSGVAITPRLNADGSLYVS